MVCTSTVYRGDLCSYEPSMHLTLKKEATKPPGKNFLQQQARFDQFIRIYNEERPHQAIAMRYPAELYKPSPRPYAGLQELHYPFHDMTITVMQCGRLCFGRRKINLSRIFAGQNVGVREIADHIWLISFMHYDLGLPPLDRATVFCPVDRTRTSFGTASSDTDVLLRCAGSAA